MLKQRTLSVSESNLETASKREEMEPNQPVVQPARFCPQFQGPSSSVGSLTDTSVTGDDNT